MPDLPHSEADPELAALVRPRTSPEAIDDAPTAAFLTSEPDAFPTSEPDVDSVPVLPVTAAVIEDEPWTQPRRRPSLAFRFGISLVVGFVLALGIGVGGLYAYGQQYEGRVLPGVRIGTTDLGGLTREQAEGQIATAYGSLGTGEITLTGPDGHS